VTIAELARLIADAAGFSWADSVSTRASPTGTPRKLLDTSRLAALGWRPKIALKEGIELTYRWFQEHVAAARL
jgi:GDP-L-fucose synthase